LATISTDSLRPNTFGLMNMQDLCFQDFRPIFGGSVLSSIPYGRFSIQYKAPQQRIDLWCDKDLDKPPGFMGLRKMKSIRSVPETTRLGRESRFIVFGEVRKVFVLGAQ
jgi:hypothetical protein